MKLFGSYVSDGMLLIPQLVSGTKSKTQMILMHNITGRKHCKCKFMPKIGTHFDLRGYHTGIRIFIRGFQHCQNSCHVITEFHVIAMLKKVKTNSYI